MEGTNEAVVTFNEAKAAVEIFSKPYKLDGLEQDDRRKAAEVLKKYITQTCDLKTHLGVGLWNICSKKKPEMLGVSFVKIGEQYFGTLIKDEEGKLYNSLKELCINYTDNMLLVQSSGIERIADFEIKSHAMLIKELNLMVMYSWRYEITNDYQLKKELTFGFCVKKSNGYFTSSSFDLDNGELDSDSIELLKDFLNVPIGLIYGSKDYEYEKFKCVALRKSEDFFQMTYLLNSEQYKFGKEKELKESWSLAKLEAECDDESDEVLSKAVVEKTNKGFVAVRCFYQYRKDLCEFIRIYIGKNSIHTFFRTNKNKWIKWDIKKKSVVNGSLRAIIVTPSDVSGTVLDGIFDENNDTPITICALLSFVTNTRVEQMAKSKIRKFVLYELNAYAQSSFGDVCIRTKEEMENRFISVIKPNQKESSLRKWLGLNNYQIGRICDSLLSENGMLKSNYIISDIKGFFNKNDISHIDDKTFDIVIGCWNKLIKELGFAGSSLSLFPRMGRLLDENFNNKGNIKNRSAYLKRLTDIILSEEHTSYSTYYIDYLAMLSELGLVENGAFELYPKTAEQLVVLHDRVVEIYNLKRNEYNLNKFKQQIKKVERLEYESEDFEFVVKSPQKPEDLATEGAILCHCVKSYIGRVTDGLTNIVFIRKKDDPGKPFFTVEVDNHNTVQQVHGFGNCNTSAVDGLTEFVKEWAKAKNLNLYKINKVR